MSPVNPTIWSVHCSNEIHDVIQGSQTDGSKQGYKNTSVPLVGQSHIQPNLSPSYTDPSSFVLGIMLDCIVSMEKSELEPKEMYDFIGQQFNLKEGKVRPILGCWQALNFKIQKPLTDSYCHFRQLMSLIGLLTAIEKQVYLGWFHMRPIQWHQKKSLHGSRILGKYAHDPKNSPLALKMVAPRSNCHSMSATTVLFRSLQMPQGYSLRGSLSKRDFVPTRKQVV